MLSFLTGNSIGKYFRSKISSLKERDQLTKDAKSILKDYESGSDEKHVYKFSELDLKLYVAERASKLYPVECIEIKDDFKVLRIQNMCFYWPKDMPSHELPWLFHEVFDPFAINPSSYDHPMFNRKATNWIMDAGAGEGFYSLFAMDGYGGKIVALEPHVALKESLYRTLENSKTICSFEVISKAVGHLDGQCVLSSDQSHICESTVERSAATSGSEMRMAVEMTTIDALVSACNLRGPGIIKMDIEGLEADALKGAEKTIRDMKPQLAVAVYHQYENARDCARIVLSIRPDYKIEFRGMYGYFAPPRPYMMFAY